MIMPIRAIQLSKIKGRKKLAAETAGEFMSASLAGTDSHGGDERARTADLLVANQALSRLSYIPNPARRFVHAAAAESPPPPGGAARFRMVGLPGFEPGTSRLSGARSDQLSYRPATSPARPKLRAPASGLTQDSAEPRAPEPGRPASSAVASHYQEQDMDGPRRAIDLEARARPAIIRPPRPKARRRRRAILRRASGPLPRTGKPAPSLPSRAF